MNCSSVGVARQLRPLVEAGAELVELAVDVLAGAEVGHRQPLAAATRGSCAIDSCQASTSMSGGGVGGIVIDVTA